MEVGEEGGTLPAQHTTFNTLDNWGHKTPTQIKKEKDRKERIKWSWPGFRYLAHGLICTSVLEM